MKNASLGIRVLGISWLALGAILLLVSKELVPWSGFPETHEFWIRVTGMLLAFIGVYYIQASRYEARWFIRTTIWCRIAVVIIAIGLVVLKTAPAVFLAFAVIDGAGALWTALCLRGAPRELGLPAPRDDRGTMSPAESLTMHYIENLVEKPATNEGLLAEYVKGLKRFEGAIGGDD